MLWRIIQSDACEQYLLHIQHVIHVDLCWMRRFCWVSSDLGRVSADSLRQAVIPGAAPSKSPSHFFKYLPLSISMLAFQTEIGHCAHNQRTLENLTMVKMNKVLLDGNCHNSKHGRSSTPVVSPSSPVCAVHTSGDHQVFSQGKNLT